MVTQVIPTYSLFINNQDISTEEKFGVLNKYTQEVEAYCSVASNEHVDAAISSAKEALKEEFSSYQRYEVLMNVAQLLGENKKQFAETLTKEVGKTLNDSYGEVDRAIQTLILSAEEAKRIHGEGIPVESAPGSENRVAFTIRVPVGVVAAITPFNVPLNLVCHKIGPALAAGNSVVLKPAEQTSLVAILLTRLFYKAGLPKGRLNLITGSGRQIGEWLLSNKDVNMFTFTGSQPVGEYIRSQAGLRKVTLELGNNSATIVHKDANIKQAASLVAERGFNNAGQVCISVQRVFIHEEIEAEFLKAVKEKTESLILGDPLEKGTDIGPMISEAEALRVEQWVKEAVEQGAELVTGGFREGALMQPTVLNKVTSDMKVSCQEVFGPVISICTYNDVDQLIESVNDSEYGLQAGIFTNDLKLAMSAAKKIDVGGLIVNDTSAYRVDQMPYGGTKSSGTGKEGPKYAVEEMTEERLIVFNL